MHERHTYDVRKIFTILYFVAFAIYLIIGLTPAEAIKYEIDSHLEIPRIGLASEVTALELSDHKLDVPDTIVGSYTKSSNKIFLVGHSTTVFKSLYIVAKGDRIIYDGTPYIIKSRITYRKDKINMQKLLAPATEPTLVIMTCAGEINSNLDASHRLIVTAVKE